MTDTTSRSPGDPVDEGAAAAAPGARRRRRRLEPLDPARHAADLYELSRGETTL